MQRFNLRGLRCRKIELAPDGFEIMQSYMNEDDEDGAGAVDIRFTPNTFVHDTQLESGAKDGAIAETPGEPEPEFADELNQSGVGAMLLDGEDE